MIRLLAIGVCLAALSVSTHLFAVLLIPKDAGVEEIDKIIANCFWGHVGLLAIMCAVKYGMARLPEGQRLLKAILNSLITLALSVSSTVGGLHFEENAKAIGWLVGLNIMVCSGMAFIQIAVDAVDDFGVIDFVTAMLLGVVAHLRNTEGKWHIIILVGFIGIPRHWIDYFHRRLHPPAQQVLPPPPQQVNPQGNPEPVDPQAPQVNPEPAEAQFEVQWRSQKFKPV